MGGLLPTAWSGKAAAAEPVSAQQVGSYTVFNVPTTSGQPDYAIENHLVQLVDGAPSGSAIHGAMFSWTRTAVAEALARARARGVNVYLAIDREGAGGVNADPNSTAMNILRNANLNRLVFCGNTSAGNSSCIANRSNSINHNKLFTFSSTGGRTNVVVVSSHNLTNSQNANHNNILVLHEEPDLYGAFLRHMDNLLAQRRNNNYYTSPTGYFRSPTSDARVFHSPRATSTGGTGVEASTDLIVGRLRYITRYEAGCSVDVAHAQFTGPRAAVADELIRIGNLGCRVRVIGGSGMTDYISNRLAGRRNITVRRLDNLHSKYIIYRGNYNAKPGRGLVFTGSQNLTGPALRVHDETLIRVEYPNITADYRGNFSMLWSRAR
jgi:phosphatidylserine/phosphatidylglycerophosphate/cardiolipin synthase-like enzyme